MNRHERRKAKSKKRECIEGYQNQRVTVALMLVEKTANRKVGKRYARQRPINRCASGVQGRN